MFYRENGQFKTSYRADQQIFPIAQDRIALGVMLAIASWWPMLATGLLLPRHFDSTGHHVDGRLGREHFGGLLRPDFAWLWGLYGGGGRMVLLTSLSAFRACR